MKMKYLVLACAVGLLSGCAGNRVTMMIHSSPAHAMIAENGIPEGTAPLKLVYRVPWNTCVNTRPIKATWQSGAWRSQSIRICRKHEARFKFMIVDPATGSGLALDQDYANGMNAAAQAAVARANARSVNDIGDAISNGLMNAEMLYSNEAANNQLNNALLLNAERQQQYQNPFPILRHHSVNCTSTSYGTDTVHTRCTQ